MKNVNEPDDAGNTALHVAALTCSQGNGVLLAAQALLELGASRDACDGWGCTPLEAFQNRVQAFADFRAIFHLPVPEMGLHDCCAERMSKLLQDWPRFQYD